MDFQFRHINRLTYPQKHILVCEDDMSQQKRILEHFTAIFEPQGLVQVSVVPGALMAAGIITSVSVDLIILDHDMPQGNGKDLIEWLKKNNNTTPIITFSGIGYNNTNMMTYGATHLFGKEEVISRKADVIIKSILGLSN